MVSCILLIAFSIVFPSVCGRNRPDPFLGHDPSLEKHWCKAHLLLSASECGCHCCCWPNTGILSCEVTVSVCVCVVSATCAASKRSSTLILSAIDRESGWSKREDVTVLVLEAAVRPVAHPTGPAQCVFVFVSACMCTHQRTHMKQWLNVLHYPEAQHVLTSCKTTNYITFSLVHKVSFSLVIFVTFSH